MGGLEGPPRYTGLTSQSTVGPGPAGDIGEGQMRAAAVQLSSTEKTDRNLEAADRLTRAAAADGARLVVLPERLDIRGADDHYEAGARPLDSNPAVLWAR